MAQIYDENRGYSVRAFDSLLTRRVGAFVIDYALVLLLMVPAFVLWFFLSLLTLGLGFYLFPALFFIVAGLYFGFGLSSTAQATPGMRVMDLRMQTDLGNRIDFFTALAHVVIFWILNSLLTPFILLVGLFTDRKRLLHDIALGTVMVRASRTTAIA